MGHGRRKAGAEIRPNSKTTHRRPRALGHEGGAGQGHQHRDAAGEYSSTRPNISESHSETRVLEYPFSTPFRHANGYSRVLKPPWCCCRTRRGRSCTRTRCAPRRARRTRRPTARMTRTSRRRSGASSLLRVFHLFAFLYRARGSSGAVCHHAVCMAQPCEEPHHSGWACALTVPLWLE